MGRNKKQFKSSQSSQVGGYTIIEVMIFLSISAVLAVSALVGMSGQQKRTEFAQSSREAEARFNDVMNDFVTGFSPVSSSGCSAGAAGGSPGFSGASPGQGENYGCSFIGKVVQLSPDGNPEGIRIYNIVGRQFKADSGLDPVSNIIEAYPVVLTDNIEESIFGYGLRVGSMTIDRNGVDESIGAVGFFSSFAELTTGATGNEFASGKQVTTVLGIPASVLGQSQADMIAAIENIRTYAGGNYAQLSADYVNKPIQICLLSGGSDQRAVIEIGDNQGRVATKLSIENGSSCV